MVTSHKDARFQSPKRKDLKRKRKQNQDLWKRNVRKRNRQAGLPYISQRGKEVPERKMKSIDCSRCRFKCSENISEEERQTIFRKYWGMMDYSRQRDFLCQHVTSSKPVRTAGHKMKSYVYKLSLEHKKVRVCITFFLATLNIGKKTIYNALLKTTSGIFSGADARGKKESVNKTPTESVDTVRRHIESFPRMESHYTRQTSKREYLSKDLSIRKMWQLYVDMCKRKKIRAVKEKKYRQIFCEEYNFSFFKPKKDQCSICSIYELKKSREEVDEAEETNYKEHQERKVQAREEKAKDKKKAQDDPTFHAATFDLQAVLTTPCSLVGELYYKRKLSCYNLSFYSLGNNNGTCYLWDETQGGRGSCEIASCLTKYTHSISSTYSRLKEVTYYSDTCGGQNRNKFVAAALLHLISSDGTLECINHKYFERGHSQMESDSIHSTIEAAKKKTSVYVPSQWNTVISLARRKKPYTVIPIKYKDIMDFKDFTSTCCPNMKFTTTGSKVNWMKAKWIQVRKSSPRSVYVNETFNDADFQEIKVQHLSTRSKGRAKEQWVESIKSLYDQKLSVSRAKKADLISLCTNGIIPEEYHSYYNCIPTTNSTKDKIPMPNAEESDYSTDSDE